jgi:hypothetical protein
MLKITYIIRQDFKTPERIGETKVFHVEPHKLHAYNPEIEGWAAGCIVERLSIENA